MVAKGEEPVFGSTTVSVGSFGAKLAAITIDDKNLSQLPEGSDPAVSVPDADIRVFAIHGSSANVFTGGGGAVTLNDFKKLSEDGTVFLVLVTGLHDSGKKDYTVTVGLPTAPTLDELVGDYPGSNMLVRNVYIADEIMAEAQSGGDGGDSGCDAQTLAMLKGMEGQEMPIKLVIKKTGDNSGSLAFINEDSKKADVGTILRAALDYSGGRLVFDYEEDGELCRFSDLACGKQRCQSMRLTYRQRGRTLCLHLCGSKPLVNAAELLFHLLAQLIQAYLFAILGA